MIIHNNSIIIIFLYIKYKKEIPYPLTCLYYVSGSRILWEKAIAFSPRCSETAERRLQGEGEVTHSVVGGRIYSEIIRVWDIVLDHDKIYRYISIWFLQLSWLRVQTATFESSHNLGLVMSLSKTHKPSLRTKIRNLVLEVVFKIWYFLINNLFNIHCHITLSY